MKISILSFLLLLSFYGCSQRSTPESIFRNSHRLKENVKVKQDALIKNLDKEVYLLQVIGSHRLPFLVIGNNERGYEVLEKYDIESLIAATISSFTKLEEEGKIDFLEKLAEISRAHLKTEGWDVLEDDY